MSKEAFEKISAQLQGTIEDLFAKGQTTPTILLIYATIDILSSLARPMSRPDTHPQFFRGWVTEYMLPDSQLPCNAEDIYAARCGLLHTLTAESRHARLGYARMVNYVGDNELPAQAVQDRNDPNCTKDIFVGTTAFVNAFFTACNRFQETVISNSDLQSRVYSHASVLVVETRGRLT